MPDRLGLVQILGREGLNAWSIAEMSVDNLPKFSPTPSPSRPRTRPGANEITKKYPEGRQASAVISLLWRAQKQNDYWLPRPAIEAVAQKLGMAYIRVLEIATFYTMFNLSPVGKLSSSFAAPRRACSPDRTGSRPSSRSASASRALSRPTAIFRGPKSNVSGPAAMRPWCRSTMTTTRI